ncbi:hypothetical protein BIY24_08260 [Halobacteriovorax marinus]|uniref:hypothetical protein n=1 Tax=Halobacteriovorax marinus TaxID=97084 RepID=UPI000BC2DB9F|nr:hypothetical protein [Halobacteriovorax marinus]ATH07943.1 hypothetical protein BIY24_08260 [Halobacteriovorax marinus]
MKKTLICFSIFILLITLYRCRDFIYYTRMWLTYEPKVFMGNIEPPFPNWFEVMWSLKGPDRNKNGIRDDVEIYINNEFKDLNESEIVMAYNIAALDYKTLVLDSTTKYRKKYWFDENVAIECFSNYSLVKKSSEDKFGDIKYREYLSLVKVIYHQTMNTYLRKVVSKLFLNKFNMWGFEISNPERLYRDLNMWKYCGLVKQESDKVALSILKEKFRTGKTIDHLNNLKEYEKEYGKENRYLYEIFFTLKDIEFLNN